ncbi:glucosamine-6-phosphate deaminase [Peptostreptococcus russellii]|uniref:Glucosamine-6-phosphate deaminase n=1 Tax=Peptostreptococcus russellii TaxID=215200 RepID=A0A1H8I5B6_9FIRM|nr:glucosamine-6-phosphate deaminase [Peptostreptococcus russellii]SEN63793.1 glucosamine-6-phosphate deaminase [Peptostreptococcus russellii]
MKIYVCKNYEKMSALAANYVAAQVLMKPESVLGLATGSTPIGMYEELVDKYQNEGISFKDVTTFNLDEYINLPKENENSYYTFMHDNLFDKIDVKEENINIPDGNVEDFETYSKEFENKIKECGGIDIQVLGIGNNAHIGFNEPDDHFSNTTGVVKLTESTILANSRFFDSEEEVPKKAISMGIGTIVRTKKILLLASGKGKAEAIYKTVCGPVKPEVPASILQFHNDVVVIIDEEAASLLDESIYERV